MSKRKVKFAENEASNEEAGEPSASRFKEENTIESDEELEETDDGKGATSTNNILTEDDIEGLLS